MYKCSHFIHAPKAIHPKHLFVCQFTHLSTCEPWLRLLWTLLPIFVIWMNFGCENKRMLFFLLFIFIASLQFLNAIFPFSVENYAIKWLNLKSHNGKKKEVNLINYIGKILSKNIFRSWALCLCVYKKKNFVRSSHVSFAWWLASIY